MSKYLKRVVVFLALIPIVFFYLQESVIYSRTVNTQLILDQKAHIDAIQKIRESNFKFMGDRNRMPLYQYIQAVLPAPGLSDPILFERAKIVNIILSLLLITIISLITMPYLSSLSNLSLILIVAFTVFLPKAGQVSPELLFYTVTFTAILVFIKTINLNKPHLAILSGILAAVGYLVKATMLMGFVLFIIFQTGILFTKIVKDKKKTKERQSDTKKLAISIILSVVSFIAVLSPYLLDNKRVFKRYFFNYNTNVYIWYDSWAQMYNNPNWEENPDLWLNYPDEEKPGILKYLKSHSPAEIGLREIQGILFQIFLLTFTSASLPFSFVLLYFLVLLFLVLYSQKIRRSVTEFLRQRKLVVSFIMLYLLAHLLAFSWNWVIGSGARFILSLYIPVLFSLFYLFEYIYKNILIGKKLITAIHLLAILVLVAGLKISLIPILFSSSADPAFSSFH